MRRKRTLKDLGPPAFFVLRTPLLPVETLLGWSSGLGARAAFERGDPLEPALATDRAVLRSRLTDLIARPEIREALFVASPSLDESLENWFKNPDSDRGLRTERAVVCYLARMTTRATPFGLFAGISLGTIGSETRLKVGDRQEISRHTRLDNDYLFALLQALEAEPPVREVLRFRPNDTLWYGAGRARYVEARLKEKVRSYHLVSVEDSPELRATLAKAGEGATRQALAAALVSDEIELVDAEAFVAELIESQVLVPSLALPVTGDEPLPVLVRELDSHEPTRHVALALSKVGTALDALDAGRLGADPSVYRDLARTLEPLPTKVELSRLFQVDLVRPALDSPLGTTVLREIERGIETLHRLTPGRPDPLARLREAFTARYEGREVPLLEAMDEETGVGAALVEAGDPSPLLRDIRFPAPAEEKVAWSAREAHLVRMLSSALKSGQEEIVLRSEDLEQLTPPGTPRPLPDGFELLATVLAPSARAVAQGDFRIWLDSASGPPGARYLGRFCHADPALAAKVADLLRAEQAHDPEAVYAEIVHLPEGRMGNILLRPQLREYEITYLGRSGAPREQQLTTGDLLLSVEDDRFVLRSRRLGRRIIPRLTTAHSYSTGLGVYRFLCQLQSAGLTEALYWSWGPLAQAPVLPRIRLGRLILCPQRWHLDKKECADLAKGTGAERFRRVQEWRAAHHLPRWIVLAQYDNKLPIDLDNVLSVEAMVQQIKGGETASFEEAFLGPDDLLAEGPDGRYVHQMILPYARPVPAEPVPRPRSSPQVPAAAPNTPPFPRRFPPGSEWLYAKFYGSPAQLDEVLLDAVGPLTRELMESGAADGWFFIRYADPDWHLRWRLHGVPEQLVSRALPALHDAAETLLERGLIWRFQLDTYEREVERYGGPEGMLLSERLFQADSEAVLEILELLDPGDAGLDERWRLGLRGMADLVDDLGLKPAQKLEWALGSIERRVQTKQRGEFRARLTERYRKERSRLEPLLDPEQAAQGDLAPGLEVFRHRSEQVAAVAKGLRSLEKNGRLTVPIATLARSYTHMHCNRLLRSAQVDHEIVLLDFLARLYQSRAARAAPPRLTPEPA